MSSKRLICSKHGRHDDTVKGQMEAERRFSMLKPSSSSTEKHDNKHEQPRLSHRKGHD